MKKSRLLSGSAAAVATLGVVALAGAGAYADESASTQVTLAINPVLSITATENLDLEITPTAAGRFTSGNIDVSVTTNSEAGYKLYLSSSSSDTALENLISSSSIPTMSAAASSNDMDNNTWGYTLDETFNPVPESSNPVQIKETNEPAIDASDITSVTVGAKVDTSIPSGSYTNTLLFTAVAKDAGPAPTDWAGLLHVDYMQDMTDARCASLPTPSATATETSQTLFNTSNTNIVPELKLTDSRDDKEYIVRKLADGNCWMSQNLAYEIAENTEVEISNNDGTVSTATPDHDTITSAGETWEKVGDTWRSFKPGLESAYYQEGYIKSSEPTAEGDEYAWESAGIYYNWYAATGGSGTSSMDSGDAPSSICPQGWRLPTSAGTKSLYNLFREYGFNDDGEAVLTDEDGLATALRTSPLNFTLAGGYNWMSAKLDHATENGFYWMSTAYDYDNAYRMSSKLNYIKPQGNYHKGYGMPVRCVNI